MNLTDFDTINIVQLLKTTKNLSHIAYLNDIWLLKNSFLQQEFRNSIIIFFTNICFKQIPAVDSLAFKYLLVCYYFLIPIL